MGESTNNKKSIDEFPESCITQVIIDFDNLILMRMTFRVIAVTHAYLRILYIIFFSILTIMR